MTGWKPPLNSEKIAALSWAINSDPNNAVLWARRAAEYEELHADQLADVDYEQVSECEFIHGSGTVKRIVRKPSLRSEKIAALSWAINSDPNNAVLWAKRAAEYEKLHADQLAIFDYAQAIECEFLRGGMKKETYNALFKIGWLYSELGEHEHAIESYTDLIDRYDRDGAAYNNIGCAHEKMGNLNQALRHFDLALEVNPEDYYPMWGRGRVFMALNEWEKALNVLNAAYSLKKDNVDIYRLRKKAYRQLLATYPNGKIHRFLVRQRPDWNREAPRPEIRGELLRSQEGKCANPECNADLEYTEYHLDHIVPRAKDGGHEDENLQLLCAQCNLVKKTGNMDDLVERTKERNQRP